MSVRVHAQLLAEPLSVERAYSFVASPAAGAVVVFTGTVRDNSDDQPVQGLTYEAYGELAEQQLQRLAAAICERWPVTGVWLEHRTGDLAVSEPAVVVAVSAPHRDQAFEAARWGIDELKTTVAIWKQEHWADGGARWPGLDM